MEEELRLAWQNALEVVFKDLPRLAARVTVSSSSGGTLCSAGEIVVNAQPALSAASTPSASDTEGNSVVTAPDSAAPAAPAAAASAAASIEITTWRRVQNVVAAVSSIVQPALCDSLPQWCDALADAAVADQQSAVRCLFERHIGLDSPVFRVFRAVHQSILVPALVHLKTGVFAPVGALKDVRRADGWTIAIALDSLGRCMTVTHSRWEQSLDAPDDQQHFGSTVNERRTFGLHPRLTHC
jgi:hypothetical protein